MKRFATRLGLFLTLLVSMIFARPSAAVESVLRISDGQTIDLDRMIDESRDARYFFLAENHDDAWHHAAQLAIIKALQQSGRKLAIGLEMFTVSSQGELDQWVAGKLPLAEFRKVYTRNWTLPWSLYEDIFLYARDNRIPLIGLNLPPGISRKVATQGFAALTPRERRQLPAGITCNVGTAYMAFIRQAYGTHAMQGKDFAYFCEAQQLWNRNMERQLEKFLGKHPGHTMVALVGIGHALKMAAPAEIPGGSGNFRVVMPEFAGLNRHNLTSQDADYLLLSGDKGHD